MQRTGRGYDSRGAPQLHGRPIQGIQLNPEDVRGLRSADGRIMLTLRETFVIFGVESTGMCGKLAEPHGGDVTYLGTAITRAECTPVAGK